MSIDTAKGPISAMPRGAKCPFGMPKAQNYYLRNLKTERLSRPVLFDPYELSNSSNDKIMIDAKTSDNTVLVATDSAPGVYVAMSKDTAAQLQQSDSRSNPDLYAQAVNTRDLVAASQFQQDEYNNVVLLPAEDPSVRLAGQPEDLPESSELEASLLIGQAKTDFDSP